MAQVVLSGAEEGDRISQPGHYRPTADNGGLLPVVNLHPKFTTSETAAGLGDFVF